MSVAQKLFTVHEVARIFGLKESRIRYWSQTGFVSPSGSKGSRRLYTFGDLVGIKTAKELLDQGIPLQRVRKNLTALRKSMPDLKQPLSAMRVRCDGDSIVVEHEDGTFEPATGQLLLDFDVEAVRTEAAKILHLHQPIKREPCTDDGAAGEIMAGDPEEPLVDNPTTAYGWFMRGCSLDANEDPAEAMAAYRKALELDPGLAAACTNLGNLLYSRGERKSALHYYQQACALDPEQPEAVYNLANVLEEEGDLEMAIAEYRRVLRLKPEFADAHFNLALTLERVGGRVQAMEHWEKFLELAEGTEDAEQEWIQLARSHLTRLKSG